MSVTVSMPVTFEVECDLSEDDIQRIAETGSSDFVRWHSISVEPFDQDPFEYMNNLDFVEFERYLAHKLEIGK